MKLYASFFFNVGRRFFLFKIFMLKCSNGKLSSLQYDTELRDVENFKVIIPIQYTIQHFLLLHIFHYTSIQLNIYIDWVWFKKKYINRIHPGKSSWIIWVLKKNMSRTSAVVLPIKVLKWKALRPFSQRKENE